MRATGRLGAMRRHEFSRQTDTCTITAEDRSGEQVIDPDDGSLVWPTTTVYSGRCRIPVRNASTSDVSAGGGTWTVGEFPLNLPFDGTDDVAVGQKVTYDSAAEDPGLVGRVFTITEVGRASAATARKLRVKEVQG